VGPGGKLELAVGESITGSAGAIVVPQREPEGRKRRKIKCLRKIKKQKVKKDEAYCTLLFFLPFVFP
jgi:hypothetical protein